MRGFFKLIFWLILLSPFALAAGVWFALSDDAQVQSTASLSHIDIARAQKILKSNDPRKLPAGTERKMRVTEQDLNLVANFLLQKLPASGARVSLHPGFFQASATVRIPKLPIRQYLNIQLQIENDAGKPGVRRLQFGAIKIPSFLAELALAQGAALIYKTNEYKLATDVIKKLDIQKGHLLVTYLWNPELLKQARESLLSDGDEEAMAAYYAKLIDLQAQGLAKQGSLTRLLKPMFALANERSVANDPIVENQSLLAILGAWASGHGLNRLIPNAATAPARFRLKLEHRYDFAQHFLTSAALAAKGDGQLADAVGLFKEISDSRGGSGFSFTDIAADRAGTRFGQLAVRSDSDARRVQNLLAKGVIETDIMPKARDLPEHMKEAEFLARFDGVGSEAYKQMMSEIERRIAACSIYQ